MSSKRYCQAFAVTKLPRTPLSEFAGKVFEDAGREHKTSTVASTDPQFEDSHTFFVFYSGADFVKIFHNEKGVVELWHEGGRMVADTFLGEWGFSMAEVVFRGAARSRGLEGGGGQLESNAGIRKGGKAQGEVEVEFAWTPWL